MSHERPLGPGSRLAPFSLALLALGIRLLPIGGVFRDGRVYFTDSDSYYHLRRIVYQIASFPEALETDAYLNFPVGAKAIWPPTLDWVLAAALLPFGSTDDVAALERALVFVPPLVGAVTVYFVYRIAERQFDAGIATAAALLVAVLPAHYWYSQVGFLDHHVVVSLLATLLFGATLAGVARCDARPQAGSRAVAASAGLGLLLASNLVLWPGSLLYVALALGSLCALVVLSDRAATRKAGLDSLAIAAGTGLLAIAPFSFGNEWPQWGNYSAVVLSRFQPWFFAVVLCSTLSIRFVRARGFDGPWWRRALVFGGIGASYVAASFLLFPGLADSVRDSTQWLGRTDAFQGLVGESVPLFVLHGEFTTQIASSRLSLFLYVFPFAACWLGWRSRNGPRAPERMVLVAWAVALLAMTLLQKRFFNTFAIPFSVLIAATALPLARHWIAPPRWGIPARRAVLAVVFAIMLAPSLVVYLGPMASLAATLRGAPPEPNRRLETNQLRSELTDWLREHTEETSGFLGDGLPEYGVLARWGEGHFITYAARRPAVIGNFGDDLGREHFVKARSFFSARPDDGVRLLAALRVRYLVIRSRNERRSLATQIFRGDGSRLDNFRLVHEVRPIRGSDVPSYKVFEFVKGASVVGRAPARALVRAELDLTTNLGRSLRFEQVTEADASGAYRLTLPIPNTDVPAGVRPATRYRIRVADRAVWLAVDEAAVREGARVEGPRF